MTRLCLFDRSTPGLSWGPGVPFFLFWKARLMVFVRHRRYGMIEEMEQKGASIRDIMTKEVISVHPDTPILEAHDLMMKYSIEGVPVVDEENRLVGILTEYDLLSKGSAVHLPTMQKLFMELPVSEEDRSRFREAVQDIMALRVRDVMNDDPLTLPEDASLEQVVATFRAHHRVNPIPVVDEDRKVVGVVSRFDVLKLFTMLRFHSPNEERAR